LGEARYVSGVLPILLCAPKFLDGSMTLGEVMRAASAFTIVQTAFSWLVDNYPRLADWTASASRVATLMVSLDGPERAEGPGSRFLAPMSIVLYQNPGSSVSWRNSA
jgi:ABC-type uncharacterized transport system fused permease/ATPase subunit